jgi:hypothetical protein
MKAIKVRLPDQIYERLKDLAKEQGVSLSNFNVSSIFNEVIRQKLVISLKRLPLTLIQRPLQRYLGLFPIGQSRF